MMEINGSQRLRFGAYEADLHTHELWKHGTRVKLIGQPFEILAVLVKRPGQLVTRDELRAQLWPGDTFVDFNHGLNAAVNKLRDALCDSADDPRYIETLPRRGYRFIAEVEKAIASRADEFAKAAGRALSESAAQVAPDTTVLPVRAAADLAEAESVPVLVSAQTQSSRRTLPWLRYSILGVVLILGLWGLWSHVGPRVAGHLHGVMTATEGAGPSTLTPLTSLADRTGNPAFSPDGRQVAFRRQSFVPGNSGIWVKQVGEEGLLQLTNGDTDCCPVWSPDGHSVAFSRLSDKQRTIYEVPV